MGFTGLPLQHCRQRWRQGVKGRQLEAPDPSAAVADARRRYQRGKCGGAAAAKCSAVLTRRQAGGPQARAHLLEEGGAAGDGPDASILLADAGVGGGQVLPRGQRQRGAAGLGLCCSRQHQGPPCPHFHPDRGQDRGCGNRAQHMPGTEAGAGAARDEGAPGRRRRRWPRGRPPLGRRGRGPALLFNCCSCMHGTGCGCWREEGGGRREARGHGTSIVTEQPCHRLETTGTTPTCLGRGNAMIRGCGFGDWRQRGGPG